MLSFQYILSIIFDIVYILFSVLNLTDLVYILHLELTSIRISHAGSAHRPPGASDFCAEEHRLQTSSNRSRLVGCFQFCFARKEGMPDGLCLVMLAAIHGLF